MVPPGTADPGDAELVVLPGSKATIADLAFLRAQGWDIDISAHHRRGGRVLGLCGGYQMLGRQHRRSARDRGAASETSRAWGCSTSRPCCPAKTLRQVAGSGARRPAASGYEMHMGRTTGRDTVRPFANLIGIGPDGATNANGSVMGTYMHGLLASSEARHALLARIGVAGVSRDYAADVNSALDEIAAQLEQHVDVDGLLSVAMRAGG